MELSSAFPTLHIKWQYDICALPDPHLKVRLECSRQAPFENAEVLGI